ncbi:hypothetical protein [Winogradskyella wichelsiae]|uniref:hypothetical protein n=1 Tax=Winogradskyella wichelsiae TaxID=2697007 RepID=UPI0015CD3E2B|nr:hypothetical protein [Winogradskyella wichelsiae]
MELNNIENLIKENFKDRSIKPSSEARNRLIVALNTKPKKKKKLWLNYAVVASFIIGLFLVGSQFFLKNQDIEQPVKIGFEKNKPQLKQNDALDLKDQNNAIVLEEQQELKPIKTRIEKEKLISNSKGKTLKQELVQEEFPFQKKQDFLVENRVKLFKEKDSIKEEGVERLANDSKIKPFQYITAEKLLQVTMADSSLELHKNHNKQIKTYLESEELLVKMETQLFDEKNKSIFKKAGKQLKELKEAVANRNYEHNH